MEKNELLIKEIYDSVFGDPWHGSSIHKILENVDDNNALAYISNGDHNIIEIVLHMWAWTDEVSNRLSGSIPAEPKQGDWPDVQIYSRNNINVAVEILFSASKKILDDIKNFPDEKLCDIVGNNRVPMLGTGISFEEMIRGLAQHNAYHAGQISFLINHFNRTKINTNENTSLEN